MISEGFFAEIFEHGKPLIGVLHAPALPGSPGARLTPPAIADWVLRDAEALVAGGMDGLLLENYGDAPFYPRRVPPHTVAWMATLAARVREQFAKPLGINLLRNDGLAALAVASAVGAQFVRVNVYTGARLTDQGIVEGEAHEITRYREALRAPVLIFADIAVKHSAPLGERRLEDEVHDTVARGRADAVIITGDATGQAAPVANLRLARRAAASAPVLAGSGATTQSVAELLRHADGVIVGAALKRDGVTANPVDRRRVEEFLRAAGR